MAQFFIDRPIFAWVIALFVPVLVRVLLQVDDDVVAVDGRVFGDDGDDVVLDLFQQPRRQIGAVVDEHHLQALLGHLATAFVPAEQSIEPTHTLLLTQKKEPQITQISQIKSLNL